MKLSLKYLANCPNDEIDSEGNITNHSHIATPKVVENIQYIRKSIVPKRTIYEVKVVLPFMYVQRKKPKSLRN